MDTPKLTEREQALDADSAAWIAALRAAPREREQAIGRLHDLLLRGARAEARRRRDSLPGPVRAELDDLCLQAADDALVSVIGKLDSFRGDSRFTTWAYGFAIFEVSTRLRRHAWRGPRAELDDRAWERLVDADGDGGPERLEHREMLQVIRTAAAERLSERQRLVFEAVVLQHVAVDVLADQLDRTRGAVYKTLHDARRTLRAALVEAGYTEAAR